MRGSGSFEDAPLTLTLSPRFAEGEGITDDLPGLARDARVIARFSRGPRW